MGQQSRCSSAGSCGPGSLTLWPSGAPLGRVRFLARPRTFSGDSVTCRLSDSSLTQVLVSCWTWFPSVPCHVGISIEHLTTQPLASSERVGKRVREREREEDGRGESHKMEVSFFCNLVWDVASASGHFCHSLFFGRVTRSRPPSRGGDYTVTHLVAKSKPNR